MIRTLIAAAALLVAAAPALAAPARVAPARAPDVAHGAVLFGQWCGYCHDPVSPMQRQLAGTSALEQRYKGAKPAGLVDRNDLTAPYVALVVRQGVTFMPFFRKTEIDDAGVADIAAFLAQRPTPATAGR